MHIYQIHFTIIHVVDIVDIYVINLLKILVLSCIDYFIIYIYIYTPVLKSVCVCYKCMIDLKIEMFSSNVRSECPFTNNSNTLLAKIYATAAF